MQTVGLAQLNNGRRGAFSLGDRWYEEPQPEGVPYISTANYSDAAVPGYDAPSTVPNLVVEAAPAKDPRLLIAAGVFLLLIAGS